MPHLTALQNSFNAGEFSELMLGRTNFDRYASAAQTLTNFQIVPQGGIVRRSGTRFVKPVADQNARVVLRKFQYSDDQAYIIEFGPNYVRFFYNEGYLGWQTLVGCASDIITDEFEYLGHAYRNGDGPLHASTMGTMPDGIPTATDLYIVKPMTVVFSDADVAFATNEIIVTAHELTDQMGIFQFQGGGILPTGLFYETNYWIVFVDANTFSLSITRGGAAVPFSDTGTGSFSLVPEPAYARTNFRVSTTPFGAPLPINIIGDLVDFTPQSDPLPPIELVSPYTADAGVEFLQRTQDANVMYIFSESVRPYKLSRYGGWGFEFEKFENRDGPYLNENSTPTTLAASAVNGRVTLTANPGLFDSGDIGRMFRIRGATHWGWGVVEALNPIVFADSGFESKPYQNSDVSTSNDRIDFGSAHPFETGEAVSFRTDTPSGTPPAPILKETVYYVRWETSNRIKLHYTEAGANSDTLRVDLTTNGTGNGTIVSALATVTGHGFVDGAGPVRVSNTGGALPLGLEAGEDYYIRPYRDVNHLYFTTSQGGPIHSIWDNTGGGLHIIEADEIKQSSAQFQVFGELDPTVVGTPTTSWRYGAWGDRADQGWPRAGVFFGNRLYVAGTRRDPSNIWGSVSGDFTVFSPTGEWVDGQPGGNNNTLLDSVNEANAISYPLLAKEVNIIQWMASTTKLIAGTTSAVWSGGATGTQALSRSQATDGTVATPADFTMTRSTQVGSHNTSPVEVEQKLLYLSSTATRVYNVGFNQDDESFVGNDLNLMSAHIGRAGLVEMSFALEPYSTVNVVRTDGQLARLTHIESQEVNGWGRWILGGSYVAVYDHSATNASIDLTDDTVTETAHGFRTGDRIRFNSASLPAPLDASLTYYLRTDGVDRFWLFNRKMDAKLNQHRISFTTVGSGIFPFGIATDAVVESCETITAPQGDPSLTGRVNHGHDQTWLVVKRTIDGATQKTIEFLEDLFEPSEPLQDYYGVDGGLTYNDTPTLTVSGLVHLAGESVDVLADGKEYLGLKVSSGGEVTLPVDSTPASIWHVGLPFTSDFQSLRLSLPDSTASEFHQGRIDHLVLRLVASLGGEIGTNEGDLEAMGDLLQDRYQLLDEIPELFSGDKSVPLDAPWETGNQFFIRQSRPLPFTLLSVGLELQKSRKGDRSA